MKAQTIALPHTNKTPRFKIGEFAIYCPSHLPMTLNGGERLTAEIHGIESSSIINLTHTQKQKILVTGKCHTIITPNILVISALPSPSKKKKLNMSTDTIAAINLTNGEVCGLDLEYKPANGGSFFISNYDKETPITIRMSKHFDCWGGVPIQLPHI